MSPRKVTLMIGCLAAAALLAAGQEANIFKLTADNDRAGLEKLLDKSPTLVNRADQNGRTPLYFAVMTGNLELARWLIERGAVVRVGDNNLRSPIHMADFAGDQAMMDMLLEKGAIIDTRAIGGATPLIHSSLADHFDTSRYLLSKGADIDVQCNSLTTPLYFAVLNANPAFSRFLIEAGADPDVPDFVGRTPLAVAVRDGNAALAEMLTAAGADPFLKDRHLNRTLLHLAAAEGHDDVAALLIRLGLKADVKDAAGLTPLDLAHRHGHASTAKILRDAGGRAARVSRLETIRDRAPAGLKPGQASLIKLQNGGWAVETASRLLVFGYSEIGAPPAAKSLANGHVAADALALGKPVVVLDHTFQPEKGATTLDGSIPLYALQKGGDLMSFILNPAYDRRYEPLGLKKAAYPKLGQPTEIDGLRVTVLPAYQTNRAYVVEADGLTIVWLTAICDQYLPTRRDEAVIAEMAKAGIKPDILLLGTPEGIGPELGRGVREAYLAAAGLGAKACFALGKEPEERRILGQIARRVKGQVRFHAAGLPGDVFLFRDGAASPSPARLGRD